MTASIYGRTGRSSTGVVAARSLPDPLMRLVLALVVVAVAPCAASTMACTLDPQPFGKACTRDTDCTAPYTCDADVGFCARVSEPRATSSTSGEGEVDGGEGEGEGAEGEGEGAEGEGEGDDPHDHPPHHGGGDDNHHGS